MKIVCRSVDPVSDLIDLKIAWLVWVSSSVSLRWRRSYVASPIWHRWKKVISDLDAWIQIAGQPATWWIETTLLPRRVFPFLGWRPKIGSVKLACCLGLSFFLLCCWAFARLGFCPLIKFRGKKKKKSTVKSLICIIVYVLVLSLSAHRVTC